MVFFSDLYTGIPSWVENCEVVTLRNTTNRRHNPESPGKSDMNEAMIYIAYRQQAGGGMT